MITQNISKIINPGHKKFCRAYLTLQCRAYTVRLFLDKIDHEILIRDLCFLVDEASMINFFAYMKIPHSHLSPIFVFFSLGTGYIENDAYVSSFIMTSQEVKVANEITGFLDFV